MSYRSEKILLEDEDMIVGQLGGLGQAHSDNLVSFERASVETNLFFERIRISNLIRSQKIIESESEIRAKRFESESESEEIF